MKTLKNSNNIKAHVRFLKSINQSYFCFNYSFFNFCFCLSPFFDFFGLTFFGLKLLSFEFLIGMFSRNFLFVFEMYDTIESDLTNRKQKLTKHNCL